MLHVSSVDYSKDKDKVLINMLIATIIFLLLTLV